MKKPTLLQLIVMNLASILFISGLILINVSAYYIFNTNIGLFVSGATLVVVSLILSYEQSMVPEGRNK